MCAIRGCGEGADVKPTPDAIAPAGNDAVDGIGKEDGDETEENGDGGPRKGQYAKGGKNGA
jgi:hypothetical protein